MRADAVHFEKERGVTEVSVIGGMAHVTITLPGMDVATGRLDLLQRLAAQSIPVFLIKLLPDGLSFAMRESVVEAGAELLKSTGLPHTFRRNLTLVTIIAGAMRDLRHRLHAAGQDDHPHRDEGTAGNRCALIGRGVDVAGQALHLLDRIVGLVDQGARPPSAQDKVRLYVQFAQPLEQTDAEN